MGRCHWITCDCPDGRAFIPGCMGGAAHASDDDPIFWCTCIRPERRPPYTRAESQRVKRLEWRRDMIDLRLRELRSAAEYREEARRD